MNHLKSSNRGFTLIEVLVALVVLSFGVLAALGLQVIASSNVQNSSQRVLAANLANDLLERMRANVSPDANDVYMTAVGKPIRPDNLRSEPGAKCTQDDPCSAAELALRDLWEWEQLLVGKTQYVTVDNEDIDSGGLVDPTACLYGPALGGLGEYRVVIVWRSTNESQNPILGDDQIDGCGNDTDQYGAGNVNRRVLSIATFL